MVQSKGLYYIKEPVADIKAGEHVEVQSKEFDLDQTVPAGSVIVKLHYASFDPYLRGLMRAPRKGQYASALTVGSPISNFGIVTILKSSNSHHKEGDVISAILPITEYAILSEAQLSRATKLENPYNLDVKLFLGALGMPGLTAYSSFYAIGEPKKGDTIFISAASGAVGQLVGQLAKREGLKVIGSVGDDAKLVYILSLGFDGGFNYKKEKPSEALTRLAPDGIDIYYENVGGEHLEAALDALKVRGRVIACGMISQYNLPVDQRFGVRNLHLIIGKQIKIQGFIVGNEEYGPRYTKEHQQNVQKWLSDGSIKARETVTKGIDNAAEGFISLYEGSNFGKAVLEVSPLA